MVYEFDTLYEGVVKQAQRYGDKDRFVYKHKKQELHFTFNDMLTHVNYISSAMAKLGVAGKFAGVTGDTHPDYVATYVATVSCGGVIVPLDKEISAEQFTNFVNLCELQLLVYTSSMHKKMLPLYADMPTVKYIVCMDFEGERPEDSRFMTFDELLALGKEAYDAGDRTAENHVVDKDALCTILFTSGTTGTSKGVMLSQRNLTTSAYDCAAIIDAGEKDFLQIEQGVAAVQNISFEANVSPKCHFGKHFVNCIFVSVAVGIVDPDLDRLSAFAGKGQGNPTLTAGRSSELGILCFKYIRRIIALVKNQINVIQIQRHRHISAINIHILAIGRKHMKMTA